MKRQFDNLTMKAAHEVRYWWLFTITGILGIALGIAVFIFPLESYVVLSILFGTLMLAVGAAKLIAASSSNNFFMTKSYVVIGGVLDVVLGIFLCVYPEISLVLLPIMMGFWLLYNGFVLIGLAADLDTFGVPGRTWLTGGAVLLMIMSIAVLVNPFGAGIATVVVLAGAGLIVFGVILCVLSKTLKELHTYFDPDASR